MPQNPSATMQSNQSGADQTNPFVRQFARQNAPASATLNVPPGTNDPSGYSSGEYSDRDILAGNPSVGVTKSENPSGIEPDWQFEESVTLRDFPHTINPPHTATKSSHGSPAPEESSALDSAPLVSPSPGIAPHSGQPAVAPSSNSHLDLGPVETKVKKPSVKPIVPVWEIDVLDVPSTVADLFFKGDLFSDLSKRLTEASSGGLKSMLVTSDDRGSGRSTVAMGMAIAAASNGLNVALVDADLESPDLVEQLGLDVPYGWPESIRSGLPIDEVAILAIQDGVTLIPMLPPTESKPVDPAEAIAVFEILSDHFDLVIIDGPPATDAALFRMAAAIDSAVVVRDMTRTSNETLAALHNRLKESGVKGVGVVENFGDAA